MSSQITEAFVQQYSNNVQMLSQQKGSLLRGVVDVETVVGKHAYFERIGAVSAQKRVQDTLTLHRSTLLIVGEEYQCLIMNGLT